MKTKVLHIIVFVAALAVAGCAEIDVTHEGGVKASAGDYIGIVPTTTRAGVNTVDALQADEGGFMAWIYAPDSAGATDQTNGHAWYHDGVTTYAPATLHYMNVHEGAGIWNFAPKVAWPGTETAVGANTGYPLDFFGLWLDPDPEPDGVVMQVGMAYINVDTPAVVLILQLISANFNETVIDPAKKMFDVLSGRTTGVQSRPQGGTVGMTMKHIFSKVDLGISAAVDHTAYVQAAGFQNVYGVHLFDAATGLYGSVDTDVAPNTADVNYYQRFFPAGDSATPVATKVFVGDGTPKPFYAPSSGPADHDMHLMMFPEDNSEHIWEPSTGNAPLEQTNDVAGQTYIQMIYRLEATGNADLVGFASAADHHDYAGEAYTGPLFVKAGWPYDALWEQGHGYTYNIALPGTTGGYLLDNFYYDRNGNRTAFAVTGKSVADPVVGGSNPGSIQLPAVVDPWDTTPPGNDIGVRPD